jgi:hypothetical protein
VDDVKQVLRVLIPLAYGLPLRLQLALQSRASKRSRPQQSPASTVISTGLIS